VGKVAAGRVSRPSASRRGEPIDVLALPGFTAERDSQPVGLLTYRRANGECELAFIAALERQRASGAHSSRHPPRARPRRTYLARDDERHPRGASLLSAPRLPPLRAPCRSRRRSTQATRAPDLDRRWLRYSDPRRDRSRTQTYRNKLKPRVARSRRNSARVHHLSACALPSSVGGTSQCANHPLLLASQFVCAEAGRRIAIRGRRAAQNYQGDSACDLRPKSGRRAARIRCAECALDR
jgi:hypothetical protein